MSSSSTPNSSVWEGQRPREETLDVLYDLSQLLHTGLDREELATLIGLTESGVNPEALAAVVKELRRESAAMTAEASMPPQQQSRAAREASAFPPPRS